MARVHSGLTIQLIESARQHRQLFHGSPLPENATETAAKTNSRIAIKIAAGLARIMGLADCKLERLARKCKRAESC